MTGVTKIIIGYALHALLLHACSVRSVLTLSESFTLHRRHI